MKPIHIDAKTIPDAWFQLLYNIFDGSYIQSVQRGSFENEQYRRQYPGASVFIEFPGEDMVPVIPPALGIPVPNDMKYIEDYFAGYIMNPEEKKENEIYTYAMRIHALSHTGNPQIDAVIEMLKKTPLTNHAVIEIAQPSDMAMPDPPCLRLIDFKVIPPDILTVSVYFRSWDLWAGFPTNMGGIELLKQLVASETGLVNGPMYAYSAGLHIYGYQEAFARIRTMKEANVR